MTRLAELGGRARGLPGDRYRLLTPGYRHVSECGHYFIGLRNQWRAPRSREKVTVRLAIQFCCCGALLNTGCDGASTFSVTRSVFPATRRSPADCDAWRIGGCVVGSGTRR